MHLAAFYKQSGWWKITFSEAHEFFLCNYNVQLFSYGLDLFWNLTFRQEIFRHGNFITGTFWAGDFWDLAHGHSVFLDISALRFFGTGTFQHVDFSAWGYFGTVTLWHCDILAKVYFSTWTFWHWKIFAPYKATWMFWHRQFATCAEMCYCAKMSILLNHQCVKMFKCTCWNFLVL